MSGSSLPLMSGSLFSFSFTIRRATAILIPRTTATATIAAVSRTDHDARDYGKGGANNTRACSQAQATHYNHTRCAAKIDLKEAREADWITKGTSTR